jgi:putative ABC transport system permease protein
VIGVLGMKGEAEVLSASIYVPLRTAQLRLNAARSDEVSLIAVRVDSRKSVERQFAVAQINTILRASHRLAQGASEDFEVNDTLSFREEMATILNTITAILSLIAGISLIVGSIGLMNIMLVSVSERTWEIGLRRAIGAQQGDILAQFLAEAVLLSLVGGVIGFVVGVAGSYAVSLAVEPIKGMVRVTPQIVTIALGVSSVVGIVAGIYPAWRAALLQPRAALRHL